MHDHAPDTRPATLHARIRAEVEARILSGEWKPGDRLPTETELMARYGCSRMTVNKAMASLAATGLISRNRRAGTVVARPRMHAAVLTIPDIRADIEARGAAYGYCPLLDEMRPPCCVHLGAEGHHLGQSRFVRSVHLADGSPVLIEDRHIFIDAVPAAATADFRSEPPGPWLLGHVPWTVAEHRIAAIAADAVATRALEVDFGTPCLLVERRTWRGEETLTIARQVFRGDAFDLTARFGPKPDIG
ncbi:MAG: UTRA domain-containing protein [Pseudotabrizicola sp.]|jgi:histidine utilization repressor|uniref:UTRA domain-containing protein n=1 Tax=Pseudotabrizicola sp. TaxID=2939647 RepID=UPI002AB98AAD|nr:UTRA domain-containing protein [Pseudotabrizicola sp.]MDZ4135200.1 UTRA domain-containing protein [Paracoccaceae bacterium]MDZ7575843.1 UTRA domain-containing protein [Pseudotabrizicola sp.]